MSQTTANHGAATHSQATIRSMRSADRVAIIALDALIRGAARATYFERRLSVIEQASAADRHILLVAEQDGAIVGFVMGTLAYGEFGLTETAAVLDSIGVHPRAQRRSVGRELVTAFLAAGARGGAERAYTHVDWQNWSLLKFFEELGFQLGTTIPLERRIAPKER
jgi:ribosomal protein S18 acetylase RimI-like enzyme